MEKFELKKLDNDKYYLNIFQGDDEIISSSGTILDKNELYDLYIKLRDIFTTNNNEN